jgi:hypothetical protein
MEIGKRSLLGAVSDRESSLYDLKDSERVEPEREAVR